jgi:putative nucleotidyltransferase with HDIG domain
MQNRESGNRLLQFAAQLPALPQALLRLLEVCNDPDTDILQVSRIVAQDVTITAKILKLANSAFLGTRSTFLDIEQAVIYLGVDTVRNLAISVSVHETFKDRPQSSYPVIEEFWHHSLLTALLAKEIAELCGYDNPAESYLAGFLHDIGKYLLGLCFGEEYGRLFASCGNNRQMLQKEQEALGISHAEAGAWLIQHWNLDQSLARAIAQHHRPFADLPDNQPLARITALANLLAASHRNPQSAIEEAAEQLQVSAEMLTTIRLEQLETVLIIAESLGIEAAPPSCVPEQCEPAGQDGDRLQEKVQSLARISGLLDNLIRAKTLNRAFLVLEESLQMLYDIEKCILLLPDESNTLLLVHGSFRNRCARSLKGLQFPLADDTSRIGRAIEDRKTVRIEKENNDFPDGTTPRLLAAFAEDFLFAVPFTISETQHGVLLLAMADASDRSFARVADSLYLLASHIGSRLCLENIKHNQAEALARERITTMEGIARTLAHEIANPLAIIQNYISLLRIKEDGGRLAMREELAIIGGELERIGTISRQLNDLSTPPRPTDLELTDIHALIGETLQLFTRSARLTKNVSIDWEGDAAIPRTWTRPGSLRQILINLVSNSLDAVDTNGWIRVESRLRPAVGATGSSRITIAVVDNGPGIPAAITDRLFRAGYTTKGDGHVGLGLAIVKKLVTDLQGKISHSTGEQGETLFVVDLPAPFEQPF